MNKPPMITYLLGAGASFGTKKKRCLPLVNEIPERIQEFIQFLQSKDERIGYPVDVERLIKYLNDLLKHLEEYNSIDAYAYILHANNEKTQFRKLKAALSILFYYWQSSGHKLNKRDMRYDSLLQTLTFTPTSKRTNQHNHTFSDNIRVLSWNYDCQFELAFLKLDADITKLPVYNKTLDTKNNLYTQKLDSHKFQILKLNGTAGDYRDKNSYTKENDKRYSDDPYCIKNYIPQESILSVGYLEKLLKIFNSMTTKPDHYTDYTHSALSFAFEEEGNLTDETNNKEKSIVQRSIDACKETEILVVIGYTFPGSNRTADTRILRSMNALKKIYIQDPNADSIIQTLESELKTITEGVELIPITKNLERFLIPEEFEWYSTDASSS